ncbi:MAG: cation transporter [Spirochaetota bacterium]
MIQRKLDLQGATCPSCAYSIEHYGRKLAGVEEIKVDAGLSEVRVDMNIHDEAAQDATLHKLIKLVQSLGYDASIASG